MYKYSKELRCPNIYGKYSTYIIAPDKAFFSTEKYRYFSYFFMKTYAVCTH